MNQRIPPLGSVRAFRVAAHCLSFTNAADQLNVTQAAISHQVKALEENLGVPLFIRGNRSLSLSDAGKRFLPYVDQMFEMLDRGLQELKAEDAVQTLTVTVLPSFASRWLVPRLGLFLKNNPDLDFRLAPSRDLTNFQTEDIDLAIRHGGGKYPGLTSIHLMDEEIYPVCSPRLMQGSHPLKIPSDLRHHILLHDEGHGDWRKWLISTNAKSVDPDKGPVYTDSAMAVQSAIEGDGVALARSQLVQDDLMRGLLVKPFDVSQPSNYSYYIVYPDSRVPTPGMESFIDWMRQQIHADAAKFTNQTI